ncbi:MAG: hypothetical protein HY234_10010 [Acidobacteria bacterium]|nr:hypothetical protein [Acidobacteriota bacterium]
MGNATHEQANLMLRLYEIRREEKLRKARAWFVDHYVPAAAPEEFMVKYPPGSEENAYIRMVASYWEMCASLVNRGLIDDELFFENNGEIWVVWEKTRGVAPAWRALFGNPHIFANLESCVKRLDAWREAKAPGTTAKMRQMFAQRAQMLAQAANK